MTWGEADAGMGMAFVMQEEAKRLAAEAAADGLAANLAEVREALEEAVAMEKQAKAAAAAAAAAAAEENEVQRVSVSATALAEAAMAQRQAATREAQQRVEAFSTALKAIEVRRVCVQPPQTKLRGNTAPVTVICWVSQASACVSTPVIEMHLPRRCACGPVRLS
jgi:hypothetical protein